VKWALNHELVTAHDLAVDSVRLRAHASTRQVRTLTRSTQRLAELAQVDTSKLESPTSHVRQGGMSVVDVYNSPATRPSIRPKASGARVNPPGALVGIFPPFIRLQLFWKRGDHEQRPS
jgi:hypothetical protein